MHAVSNQPARFLATTKTHEFNITEETDVDHLKLCPIIEQTGTYIKNSSKFTISLQLVYNYITISLQLVIR